MLAAPERQYLIDDSGARLLLAETEVAATAARVTPLEVAGGHAALDAAPHTPWTGRTVDPFAPAGLAYTSGTTGHPKGAVHSQHNLLLPEPCSCRPVVRTVWRKGDCFAFTILNLAVLTTLLVSQAGGTSIVMDRIDAHGVAGKTGSNVSESPRGTARLRSCIPWPSVTTSRPTRCAPCVVLGPVVPTAPSRSAGHSRRSSAVRCWRPTG